MPAQPYRLGEHMGTVHALDVPREPDRPSSMLSATVRDAANELIYLGATDAEAERFIRQHIVRAVAFGRSMLCAYPDCEHDHQVCLSATAELRGTFGQDVLR